MLLLSPAITKLSTLQPLSAQLMPTINHLIIVCCHAIWLGGPTAGIDEDEWAIEQFQEGETATFQKHIYTGLQILEKQPNSLLVFSGGATKRKLTPLTEGESYLALAHQISTSTHLRAERHATDSYQNILFSILQFRHSTSHYPTSITIISYAFKKPRFIDLHIPALKFPSSRVGYIGIDPPETVTSQESLIKGEEERGYGVWKGDSYGVGDVLGKKRMERGWQEEMLGVVGEGLEEGVGGLLRWRGGGSGVEVYGSRLPWDEESIADSRPGMV